MFSSIFVLFVGLLALSRPLESAKNEPSLVTQPGRFLAEIGESVTLPCDIRNPGRRTVFWFKGDAIEGRELIMQMKSVRGRFLVPRQFQPAVRSGKLGNSRSNLIINNIEAGDADSYTCSLAMAGQTVTHTLGVSGARRQAPQLVIEPQPRDGRITVGQGFPVSLGCSVSDQSATVTWQKEGNQRQLSTGPVLNIYSARNEDAGRYTCTADNRVSAPVTFTFDLRVEYVDIRLDQREVVASTDDLTALLTCYVSGYPKPSVAWYDNEGPIRNNDPRRRFYSSGDTHYLQLTGMNPNDLGPYFCYGYNDNARQRERIDVTAVPGSPRMQSVEPTGKGFTYRVTWEVDSLAPINYYYVAYRELSSDTVMSQSTTGSPDPVDGSSTLYRASTEVDFHPGESYAIVVTAVGDGNKPGPQQREAFRFDVPLQPEKGTVSSSDEGNWKWWKVGMTVLSRLPQVARVMQN